LKRRQHLSVDAVAAEPIRPRSPHGWRQDKLVEELTQLTRADVEALRLDEDLTREAVLELATDAGELKIVPEPAGTRGYDDLRRAASREPLGSGLRPSIASLGDHARMLAALGHEQDAAKLRTIRRLIELERQLGLGIER
jgi:hypothetical protein